MHENSLTTIAEIKMTYNNPVNAADRVQITNSQNAYVVLRENWSDQIGLLEEFSILLLDRSHRILGSYLVSQGGISGTVVDVRLVFCAALLSHTSSIILSHNHPSGNLQPSQADINITKKLKQGGQLLDINVIDHLILSPDGGYYSFADEGLI